jgi:hypothetical protein
VFRLNRERNAFLGLNIEHQNILRQIVRRNRENMECGTRLNVTTISLIFPADTCRNAGKRDALPAPVSNASLAATKVSV